MELELTPENRFLCGLVLSGHEFENSEQIESFLPKFLNKMSYSQMTSVVCNTLIRNTETEDFVKKIIDTEPTPDFLRQFFIPTFEKVS